jgi:hypothetical protein
VLEEVSEAAAADGFILRSNMKHEIDEDRGHAMVRFKDDLEPVRQRVLLVRDVGAL